MPSKKEFLETLLQYVEGISQENKDYLLNTLFKYDDNPTVVAIRDIVKQVAEDYERYNNVFNEALGSDNKKYETLANRRDYTKQQPIIALSPDSKTSLRIYPNLIIDNRRILKDPSIADIKTLITSYERDITRPESLAKWKTPDTIREHLLKFIDLPTARALTRYLFIDIKDTAVIRDFAEVIDNLRKPAELIFAEKPEDFVEMYASGPSSCMGYGAGDRSTWAFFDEFSITPPSWYAYYPYTKGAYLKKAGKVTARAIILQEPSTKKWYCGRIYPISSEAQKQFVDALKVHRIKSLEVNPKVPEGTTFDIPGVILKNGQVKCVWPYFDNIERPDRGNWKCVYHKETKVFTITYAKNNNSLINVQSRGGFLNATDYVHLECDYCHKAVSARMLIPADNDKTFCSMDCANNEGYVKVINGTGEQHYKLPQEQQVQMFEYPNVRYTTIKAAYDCGLYPMMPSAGVYPEDNDYRVSDSARNRYSNAAGELFGSIMHITKFPKVPVNMLPSKKLVEFVQERAI